MFNITFVYQVDSEIGGTSFRTNSYSGDTFDSCLQKLKKENYNKLIKVISFIF